MNDGMQQSDEIHHRLQALRKAMQNLSIDVLIIPTSDPHLSEYLPEHWRSENGFPVSRALPGRLLLEKTRLRSG